MKGQVMTNKEKADEISEHYATSRVFPNGEETAAYDAAMQMAEWKERQMVDKVCEWLKDNLASFWQCKFYNDIKFIEDFRKAMEGGEKC